MPAEVEEAVLGADFGQSEHLGEEPAEHLFLRGARSPAGTEGDGRFGVGQGAYVQLAVVVHGQPVEGDERGRDHVLGQPLLEVVAELPDQAVGIAGCRRGVGVRGFSAAGKVEPGGQLRYLAGDEHGVVRAVLAGPGGQDTVPEFGGEVAQRLRVDSPGGPDPGVGDAGEAQRDGGQQVRQVATLRAELVGVEGDRRDIRQP